MALQELAASDVTSVYGLHGLLVESTFAWPDLFDPLGVCGPGDFRFTAGGQVVAPRYGSLMRFTEPDRDLAFTIADDNRSVHASWRGVVPPVDVVSIFTNTVLRQVAARTDRIALHAAALRLGDEAILFIGPKGAGKSSLFAAGCAAGLGPLADDLAIPFEADGDWWIRPGMPFGRLRLDIAERFGFAGAASLPLAPAAAGKRLYRMSAVRADPLRAYRVRAIHVLAPRGGESGAFRREPLPAVAAFATLLGEVHEPTRAAARAVGRLVDQIPVARLRRADDLAMLPATLQSIAADAGWALP